MVSLRIGTSSSNYTVGKVDGQGRLESSLMLPTGKVIEGRKDATTSTNSKNNQHNLGNVYVHYVDEMVTLLNNL